MPKPVKRCITCFPRPEIRFESLMRGPLRVSDPLSFAERFCSSVN
jgi:hypothetical protein